MIRKKKYPSLTVRPYQLLCVVCGMGEDDAGPKSGKPKKILDAIRSHPDMPVTVACNAGDVYVYQDPGTDEDAPDGADYNRKRDMDILQKLDLAPGSALPARTLLRRLLKAISTTAGICGYDAVTSDAWRGCPRAKSGAYEKGHQKGIDAIIPPRSADEMASDKKQSLDAMAQAEAIAIRPHILLCAVSQFGGGVRPPFKPDNLPEFIELIRKKPDTLVVLAPGADWMMCAPCPSRVPDLNACVCGAIGSGGLYNEMKDLNVLQRLGLTYGTRMKAGELYRLIFERIPSVAGVCALIQDISPLSVWRDGCGQKSPPCPNYEKGRELLMPEFR